MKAIEVAMEEYKSLRDECPKSIELMQAVMRYGIAGAIVLMAAAVSISERQNVLSAVTMIVFIPGISYLTSLVWLGELGRMTRAGKYLKSREIAINLYINDKQFPNPLNWENHLRESQYGINGIQMQIPYLASYSIFVCISIVSTIVGIVINRQAFQGSWEAITWIASAIVLVFNLGLVGLVATRFR